MDIVTPPSQTPAVRGSPPTPFCTPATHRWRQSRKYGSRFFSRDATTTNCILNSSSASILAGCEAPKLCSLAVQDITCIRSPTADDGFQNHSPRSTAHSRLVATSSEGYFKTNAPAPLLHPGRCSSCPIKRMSATCYDTTCRKPLTSHSPVPSPRSTRNRKRAPLWITEYFPTKTGSTKAIRLPEEQVCWLTPSSWPANSRRKLKGLETTLRPKITKKQVCTTLNLPQYTLGRCIGAGTSASVYSCYPSSATKGPQNNQEEWVVKTQIKNIYQAFKELYIYRLYWLRTLSTDSVELQKKHPPSFHDVLMDGWFGAHRLTCVLQPDRDGIRAGPSSSILNNSQSNTAIVTKVVWHTAKFNESPRKKPKIVSLPTLQYYKALYCYLLIPTIPAAYGLTITLLDLANLLHMDLQCKADFVQVPILARLFQEQKVSTSAYLKRWIQRLRHYVNEDIILFVVYQIVELLEKLFKANIAHGDIKSDNFLIYSPPQRNSHSPTPSGAPKDSTLHYPIALAGIDLGCAIDILRTTPNMARGVTLLDIKNVWGIIGLLLYGNHYRPPKKFKGHDAQATSHLVKQEPAPLCSSINFLSINHHQHRSPSWRLLPNKPALRYRDLWTRLRQLMHSRPNKATRTATIASNPLVMSPKTKKSVSLETEQLISPIQDGLRYTAAIRHLIHCQLFQENKKDQVLEVSSQATDDEIKKAYRQLALRFHPDKNPTNLEEAQAQFLLVQEAYETLSDPNERAWYDSHKTQILSGLVTNQERDENAGPIDPLIERLNLFRLFRKDCFNGFSEEADNLPGKPSCFYTIYRHVFEEIAAEENSYRQRPASSNAFKKREKLKTPNTQEGSTLLLPPTFGTSKSDSATVCAFYRYWTQFTSERDYGFADKWHPNSAPNRAVRRQIETENKVSRVEARKEFQNTVRSLANWLRKRDPRVLQHAAEKKAAEALRRTPLEEKAFRQRAQAVERARYIQRERELERWRELEREKRRLERETGQAFVGTDTDDVQSASDNHRSDSEASSEDEAPTTTRTLERLARSVQKNGSTSQQKPTKRSTNCILFCEACRKTFRSEAQFQTHASSKRHRKAVEYYITKQEQKNQLHGVVSSKNLKSPTIFDIDNANEEKVNTSEADDSEEDHSTSNKPEKLLSCGHLDTLANTDLYSSNGEEVHSSDATSEETSRIASADELCDVAEEEVRALPIHTASKQQKTPEDTAINKDAVSPQFNNVQIRSPDSPTSVSEKPKFYDFSSAASSGNSDTEDSEAELLYRMRHFTLQRSGFRRTRAVSEEGKEDDTNTSDSENSETRHPNSPGQEEHTSSATFHGRRLKGKQSLVGPQRRRRRRAAIDTTTSAPTPNASMRSSTKREQNVFMKNGKQEEDLNATNTSASFTCQVCSESFQTRNKLFQHIRSTGHAALKWTTPAFTPSKQKTKISVLSHKAQHK